MHLGDVLPLNVTSAFGKYKAPENAVIPRNVNGVVLKLPIDIPSNCPEVGALRLNVVDPAILFKFDVLENISVTPDGPLITALLPTDTLSK